MFPIPPQPKTFTAFITVQLRRNTKSKSEPEQPGSTQKTLMLLPYHTPTIVNIYLRFLSLPARAQACPFIVLGGVPESLSDHLTVPPCLVLPRHRILPTLLCFYARPSELKLKDIVILLLRTLQTRTWSYPNPSSENAHGHSVPFHLQCSCFLSCQRNCTRASSSNSNVPRRLPSTLSSLLVP